MSKERLDALYEKYPELKNSDYSFDIEASLESAYFDGEQDGRETAEQTADAEFADWCKEYKDENAPASELLVRLCRVLGDEKLRELVQEDYLLRDIVNFREFESETE